jgi:integrase
MRKGEACALRWSDYRDGEITIERSVWNRAEKATKTDDPRRVVVVPPLAEVLDSQRKWLLRKQHAGLETDLMFPASERGARAGAKRRKDDEVSWYRSGSVADDPIKRIVAAAQIPPITPHSLRRTWENLLRRAGVDQLVRQSLAGWRTDEAQAIYATVDREERIAAGAAVVRMVFGETA